MICPFDAEFNSRPEYMYPVRQLRKLIELCKFKVAKSSALSRTMKEMEKFQIDSAMVGSHVKAHGEHNKTNLARRK